MADYYRIASGAWDGDLKRVRLAAGTDGLAVAFYLRSSRVASPFGLYHLPFAVICHYTGLPEARLAEVLALLERAGFCAYDQVEEVVWVPSMAGDNVDAITLPEPGKKPDKRLAWVLKEIPRLASLPFFPDLIARYGKVFHVEHLAGMHAQRPAQPPAQGCALENGKGHPDEQKPLARGFCETGTPSEGQSPSASTSATASSSETATKPATDADTRWQQQQDEQQRIRSFFDAVRQGLGLLSLPWAIEREYQMREIFRCNPAGPEEVLAVAAHFRTNMPPGSQPSFDSFCRKYGERRAQWEASKLPAPKPGSVPGALFTGAGTLCDGHRQNPQHGGTNCRLCMACAALQPASSQTAAYHAALQAEQGRP